MRRPTTRTCQLLVGLPDVVVLRLDACAGDAPRDSVTHGPGGVGGSRGSSRNDS